MFLFFAKICHRVLKKIFLVVEYNLVIKRLYNIYITFERFPLRGRVLGEELIKNYYTKKGSEDMEGLAEELLAELNCETVFTIHLGSMDIPIAESTVITWVIMALVLLLSLFLTSGLKVHDISKKQLFTETIVVKLDSFVAGMIGEEGKTYVPYLCTVILYIGIANLIGLFGVKPPTKDLNVTAALALMTIILVQYASVHKRGIKGWLRSFKEPMAVVVPINILELFIKPLSLCMRLFGNVLGAFVIMELIKILIPVVVPIPFSFYFDIFDGLIQAYVFVFLTSLYIKEAIEN